MTDVNLSRRLRVWSLATGLVAFGVFSTPGYAVITGSKHDFKSATWNSSGQICKPCHTPHNGAVPTAAAPLWNHAQTTQTFTVYTGTGGTFDAGAVGAPTITGVSKLCLSCHDGSVALNNFGTMVGTAVFLTGTTLLSTDLSNDHPVGFTYNTALANADTGLKDPATTPAVSALLFAGRVECSSCHDVHNTANVAGAGLLSVTNAGSALCLTCHTK